MYNKGMTISEVLSGCIAAGDLTQDEAARVLGVAQPTVQRWVSGKDTPSNRYVPAIVKMTGLSERRIIEAIHTQKLKSQSLPSRIATLEARLSALEVTISALTDELRQRDP